MDGRWGKAVKTGVIMDSKNILDFGSIWSDVNQEAASKIVKLSQEESVFSGKDDNCDTSTCEFKGQMSIGDYDVIYQEICRIFNKIKETWGTDDIDENRFNRSYQRDLLYLYDRITLDIEYLKEYPNRNDDWLEKLQELKFEIRNLF